MKVVCIDASAAHPPIPVRYYFPNGPIVEGETYTVSETGTCIVTGRRIYALEEKPIVIIDHDAPGGGWASRRFVPLDYFNAEFAVSETEPQLEPQKG